MLKLRFGDHDVSSIWLVQPNLTIGADSSNDIVIENLGVAPFHARLYVDGNRVEIENISDQQECYVNQELVTQRYQLRVGDSINLGKARLEVIDPITEDEQKVTESNEQRAIDVHPPESAGEDNKTKIRLPDTQWFLKSIDENTNFSKITLFDGFTIGREAHCDLVLPGSHISREHARIHIKDHKIFVEDLKSANGCFVNDQKVDGKAQLLAGDTLKVDVIGFKAICQTHIENITNKMMEKTIDKTCLTPPPLTSSGKSVSIHDFQGPWLINVADTEQKIPLSEERITVGRWADCNAVVDDASVSSRHAELVNNGKKWSLGDLASSNGTFVNGKRIQTQEIKPGDKIRFGLTEFIYSEDDSINLHQPSGSNIGWFKSNKLWASIVLLLLLMATVYVTKDWLMEQFEHRTAEVKYASYTYMAGGCYEY